MRKRRSNTQKNRKKMFKAQQKANKYAYRLERKKLSNAKFAEKQKTKRISQVSEAIKATGQSIAMASTPTAGSIASTKIADNQMNQLINPAKVTNTNNAEEEEALTDSLNKGYLPR